MKCLIEGIEYRLELHFNFLPPAPLKDQLMEISGVERVNESKYVIKVKLGNAFNIDDTLYNIKKYLEETFDGIEITDNVTA